MDPASPAHTKEDTMQDTQSLEASTKSMSLEKEVKTKEGGAGVLGADLGSELSDVGQYAYAALCAYSLHQLFGDTPANRWVLHKAGPAKAYLWKGIFGK